MLACAMLGIDIHYAVPKGYEPDEDVVKRTNDLAKKNKSMVVHTNDPVEAVTMLMLFTLMSLYRWVKNI